MAQSLSILKAMLKKHLLFLILIISLGIINCYDLNLVVFTFLNKQHTLLPNTFWRLINSLSYIKYGILPIILFISTFYIDKKYIKLVVILYMVNLLFLTILKDTIIEARPYVVLAQDGVFWLNYAENAIKNAYKSFPSGHTGNMAIFVFIFLKILDLKQYKHQTKYKYCLLLLLFLTAITRVITGWHWPIDVIFAMVLAYFIVELGFLIHTLYYK